MGLLVWIIDDSIYAYSNVKQEEAYDRSEQLAMVKNIVAGIYAVRWFGLLIWIAIIVASIY